VPIEDHPLRYQLANELHARPFPTMSCPGQVAYIALKPVKNAAQRDRSKDRDHLVALLDRHGAAHPAPDATHYSGQLGKYFLKWEQHTEFVTYTAFVEGNHERAFDPAIWEIFAEDWVAAGPGPCVTSIHLRIENYPDTEDDIAKALTEWFVPESLASSYVLDKTAVMAGDFRIAATGHMHFATFVKPEVGKRRVGRIVQRLCEIETYKAMSMLALPQSRAIMRELGPIDEALGEINIQMTGDLADPDKTLQTLLATAAELESIMAKGSFRFPATQAYEALVNQRIQVLREERFGGRQTFAEFMMRRFDPAMRTVKATERRVQSLTDRAIRAGDLLRTRVEVDRSAQNQALLESMDRRADLQLRLQKTVEGLSVVAISYYAVNLAVYILAPLAEGLQLSETMLTAMVALPVVAGVWWTVRQIRKSMD